VIKISKGLDLPISGTPDPVISDTPKVTTVSLLGNDFTGMKPTMFVKSGDIVKRGTKIFEDKKNPGVFLHHLQVVLLKKLAGEIEESFYLLILR
jgi:Na+-transporting NADH:ubiquinone oxidoreductase subunit A